MIALSYTFNEAMAKTERLDISISVDDCCKKKPDLFSKRLLWGLVAFSGELEHYDRDKKSFDNQVP
jgi:hypothetical protein